MKISNKLFITIVSLAVIITIITIANSPREINEENNYTYTNLKNNNTDRLNTSYLKISDTYLSSNSSYYECNGSISVSSYSPYKYHYIKVKAAFVNSYGSTVDTDWTYAIGSEWLEPGESKKFSLSVKKDSSIKKCIVTIMED